MLLQKVWQLTFKKVTEMERLKATATLTILTGKNCVLFNSVQEWLVGCF